MEMRCTLVLFVVVQMCLGGCATITSSETQPLTVTTATENGQAVEKASCTLKNDKREWQVQTPGFAPVRRSSDDLLVECKKEGLPNGTLRAISRAAAGMFGNIIFGGGIGAIIDHSRGTGYNYPDTLPVTMGKSRTVDRHTADDAASAQSAGQKDSVTPQ
jgi:uncharacterized protein YceK